MSEQFKSRAVTTKISATSRVAIKIKDNYYTVEYSEERAIPDGAEVDIAQEREVLFEDVNGIVDKQAEEIIKTFR